jgi:phage shock protein A
MARQLLMSAELGDWLTELAAAEPTATAEVSAAVVAAMIAADPAALALVGVPALDPVDPREDGDRAYQELLEDLQQVRRGVAEVATARRRSADALAEAEGQPGDVRTQLQLRLAEAEHRERELTERSQRLQDEVDMVRIDKELAKAAYTAAEATLRVHAALADEPDADRDQQVVAAQDRLDAAAAALRQMRPPAVPAAAGLLELHADPLGRDVRLLLAVEPADTVTLLAVLDGATAIAEHRTQAIRLAGDLLTDIRAGDWPLADAEQPADAELRFPDAASYLARFCPADGDAVVRRAADLAVARTLAELRADRGISVDDLALETGISAERLQAIEHEGLGVANVHEAAAYVRALGGRLSLTVRLGESAPIQIT